MNTSLEELFCHVDDFCEVFAPQWHQQLLGNGLKTRRRKRSLCLSEIMTILIAFHQSYYLEHVCQQWSQEFPKLVSYQRVLLGWIS